jgi:DNA-binding CsgD family transcriptional regulator/tetratricopeptide (TPR) repeat protein
VVPRGERGPPLRGRRRERHELDDLVASVRAGHSRVVVLRGEPGVGKSALLEYAAESAAGCRIARVAGDESEMELAFAGLHLVCAPLLDRLDRIPPPQREALATAFGLSAGDPPDRFLVGLAVLSLLAEVAEERPLICLIDDAHWLDRASTLALAFVARRLLAERVGMVFAMREGADAPGLGGLPDLPVRGLGDTDSHGLLRAGLHAPLDPAVMDRIVADTHGNPLALLELPRAMTPAELAGGFGLPGTISVANRLEAGFLRRIALLPAPTQRLLLLAAAEPVGDPLVVWRAAGSLGMATDVAEPAIDEGLVQLGGRVVFRHPLVRSAAYRRATAGERREVHRALAEATDADADPDRRAWHRAQAAPGPDEEVAAELEGAASRARRRGGLAAAAAFLERSVALTIDPSQRVERSLAAAEADLEAGGLESALGLLAAVDAEPLDELVRGRVDLLRGWIGFRAGDGTSAPRLLVEAAGRLEGLDVGLARESYLQALSAAAYAGRFADGTTIQDVARAARAAPGLPAPRAADVLLDGLAVLIDGGPAEALPALRLAGDLFRTGETSVEEDLRWLGLACATASATWDHEGWRALATRQVQFTRAAGALTILPIALNNLAILLLWEGDLDGAAVLLAEAEAVNEVTGSQYPPYGAAFLAGLRGREHEGSARIDAIVGDAIGGGSGHVARFAASASATLHNGLGRYEQALAAAQEADAHPPDWSCDLHLHELVEAGVRTGRPEIASDALDRLSSSARAIGAEWPLGIEARCRALLSRPAFAEDLYRDAIGCLEHTPIRLELARTHLLYGEWLRRENRRLDAREHLRTAHEAFVAMGAEAFAERAGRELATTGETVRKRTVDTQEELTAQEAQIARLAAEGRTNPEIGAELFISSRTVEWHLRKVYPKLGITSRRELRRTLPQRRRSGAPA